MKYWIFQSNQVLGPYEPDDLSRHSAFGAESLVCPEGRRGTSMGDWQRAGMVPDLSVALVRASQANGAQGSVATLAGLPPEPTLKDLAVLGSLREKLSMLENAVLQMQEGLRAKDSELAALHEELAGKDRQSSVMKEVREREAAETQAQAAEFKRKISELEDRVGVINRLSETIDKAVEAEKTVAHDVEAQGSSLAELTKELDFLRVRMNERAAAQASAPAPEPAPLPMPARVPFSMPARVPFPSSAPAPEPEPTPEPIPAPAAPLAPFAGSSALPEASPLPAFGGPLSPMPMDPLSGATSPFSPESAAATPPPAALIDVAPAPAPAGRKKALIFGALFGVAAIGACLFLFSGRKRRAPAPIAVSLPMPAPAPQPVPPPAPPVPKIDPREAAIAAAREWPLPGGRTLGRTLETLSPPVGNLSPWMAEPLTDDRVSVNYFAHGGGPGAPTVAYEFEVDLAAKTVAGRNPAAKAVIAGRAATPPAPPKAKRVKLKPKPHSKPTAAKAPPSKTEEDAVESLLDADTAPEPKAAAPEPAGTPEPKAADDKPAAPAKTDKADDEALLDGVLKE